jgi:hypothetical protein
MFNCTLFSIPLLFFTLLLSLYFIDTPSSASSHASWLITSSKDEEFSASDYMALVAGGLTNI